MDKVNPKYAVISVGKGNDYGHPHQEVMQRLQAKGIKVYKTDENGTIVATSDGKNVTFSTNPRSYAYAGSGSSSSGSNTSGSQTTNSSNSNTPSPPIVATPAPTANFTATVDNARIYLTVRGPGDSYTAVCHYKSKDTDYSGSVGSPLTIDIGRAAKGYTVNIDITINYNGKTYNTRTSFTPQ